VEVIPVSKSKAYSAPDVNGVDAPRPLLTLSIAVKFKRWAVLDIMSGRGNKVRP
jgi:hypothetical protein